MKRMKMIMTISDELQEILINSSNEVIKMEIDKRHLYLDIYHSSGYATIHYAAEMNNHEIIQYLIDEDCNVNALTRDDMGSTPLMIAVASGHDDGKTIKILLDSGADMDIKNNDRECAFAIACQIPLHYIHDVFLTLCEAIRMKYDSVEDFSRHLINAKCPLYHAISLKDAEVVEEMIKLGANFQVRWGADKRTTPLNGACAFGNLDTVRVLLRYNAEAIYSNLQGSTEAIRLVLEAIPNYNDINEIYQTTVLHDLALNKNPEVIEVLKDFINEFDLNVVDYDSNTPLTTAVTVRNVSMVKLLLEAGADINDEMLVVYDDDVEDDEDKKPLDECAKLLLFHGADVQNECVLEKLTIFDLSLGYGDIKGVRINLAIERLAFIEKQGVIIKDEIRKQIQLYQQFEDYYQKCRQLLSEILFGTVTVHKFLAADKIRLAGYMKTEKINVLLELLKSKFEIEPFYSHYNDLGTKNLIAAHDYKILRDRASIVNRKLIGNQLGQNDFLLDEILNYMNDQDLTQLCAMIIKK